MADDKEDDLRMLRRLSKSYGISFRRPDDEWPSAHSKRFRDIHELGDKKFSTYSESVTIRSAEEPWTRQIKSRTQWLVSRACDLAINVQPKESGWRMGLENDVMHRFLFEVACPTCRARIWRSEIEASDFKNNSKWEQALEERRKNRKPCQCPPESRAQDYYEIGTNLLFDDRVEEIVMLDSALKDLPKKKTPDRTFGLKPTEKVNQLLARLAVLTTTTSETLEFTPFKQLQLKTKCAAEEPLVWFFGNRGSEWKVYGCYVDEADNRPRYNIHPLWGGDLTTHDGALQLILIVDYILDWARDIYRPSILRELKSLVTGKGYDEVSLDLESDIYSVAGRVFDWIQPPAGNSEFEEHLETIVEDTEPIAGPAPTLLGDLPNGLPSTELGSFQSVSRVNYSFNGLNITEENVESLLIISQGPDDKLSMSTTHAQQLDTKLRSCGELIVTTQHALDEIEFMWTGERRKTNYTFSAASDVEVYVILEYRCFLNTSWEITKELTCLAVSTAAFAVLQKCASTKSYRTKKLPNLSNACPSTSLYEVIDCLLLDSGLQSLNASISSTLLSIHPNLIKRYNEETPSLIFEFCGLQHSQIGEMVEELSKCVRNRTSKRLQLISLSQYLRTGGKGRKGYEAFIRRKKAEIDTWSSKYRSRTANRSFARRSVRSANAAELNGHDFSCSRCSKSRGAILWSKFGKTNTHFGANWEPMHTPRSAYNTMLVKAVRVDTEGNIRQERNQFCLFILGKGPEIKEGDTVTDIIEEHLNSGKVYHSLLHGPPSDKAISGRTALWNLSFPYRISSMRTDSDLKAWIAELRKGGNLS
ncbi:hypothetical protein F4818DRAFT_453585 [Hypoxylon cercidicola]|nr:hypothetical protein F4818DRAFT_453585 [Hypoxylon cercidicola]